MLRKWLSTQWIKRERERERERETALPGENTIRIALDPDLYAKKLEVDGPKRRFGRFG